MPKIKIFRLKLLLLPLILSLARPIPCFARTHERGFLVLAADRGFLGNEDIRDAFDSYRKDFSATLVFVGPKPERFLREGLDDLRHQGVRDVVVLPLFLSDRHPAFEAARRALAQIRTSGIDAIWLAPTMKKHSLAVGVLADRAGRLSRDPAKEALVLVAQGASDLDDARAMERDLLATAEDLHGILPFARREAVVMTGWDPLHDTGESDARLRKILESVRTLGLKPVIVPLDFTTKLDSMMALSTRLSGPAREFSAAYDGADMTPHPNIALWLAQESNRRLPVAERDLGVVFMPHGADQTWNRVMLDSIRALRMRYLIEPAFGMADPVLIERAVRRLEARGARAITVVRVFSLKQSFEDQTEETLGLRPAGESQAAMQEAMAHGRAGMDMDMMMEPMGKTSGAIRSGCEFYTLGGLEDSPLFAQALLDRALHLSKDPKSETVFLLAHGAGEDEENEAWLRDLRSLASQIKDLAGRRGGVFKDIRVGTWREDWPEKRAQAVKDIREEVRAASASGTAIVIPARTALGGPEPEFLAGLKYVYDGQSFAPHPLFALWVEDQIRASLAHFNAQRDIGLIHLR